MNIQPLSNESKTLVRRVSKNKNLAKTLQEAPMEQKAKKGGMKMGSCAGMISWSNNTMPMMDSFENGKQREIKMGSCAGLVSWSMNQFPQC